MCQIDVVTIREVNGDWVCDVCGPGFWKEETPYELHPPGTDNKIKKLELIIQALMTFDSPVTGGPCWCVRQRGSSTDKHGTACTMVRELRETP